MTLPRNPFAKLDQESQRLPEPTKEKNPVKLVEVPPGTEVVLFKKEFAPELIAQLNELEVEVSKIGSITSQQDVVKANATLKKASTFINRIDAERKAMGANVKALLDGLLVTQRTVVQNLSTLVESQNTAIVNFQKEEKRKQDAEAERIRKEQEAAAAAARAEADRKAKFQNYILEYENSCLKKINASTINDIDANIATFEAFKLTEATYMEFLPQAQAMQIECRAKFHKRKADLQQLAELEAKNKERADALRKEQEEQARQAEEEQKQKAEEAQQAISESLESDIANIQMQADLKTSLQPKAHNVMTRWVFDESTIDMSKLPVEYHTFDKKKIQDAIKLGARDIPGVRIYDEISNVKR